MKQFSLLKAICLANLIKLFDEGEKEQVDGNAANVDYKVFQQVLYKSHTHKAGEHIIETWQFKVEALI